MHALQDNDEHNHDDRHWFQQFQNSSLPESFKIQYHLQEQGSYNPLAEGIIHYHGIQFLP